MISAKTAEPFSIPSVEYGWRFKTIQLLNVWRYLIDKDNVFLGYNFLGKENIVSGIE